MQKTIKILRILLKFHEFTKRAIELEVPLQSILALPVTKGIRDLKNIPTPQVDKAYQKLLVEIDEQFNFLIQKVKEEAEVDKIQ